MIVAGIVTKVKESSIGDNTTSVRVAVRQQRGDDFFMDVLIFGRMSEIVREYVPVGGQFFISGDFQMEEYKDKLYPRVVCRTVELVRSKGGKSSDAPGGEVSHTQASAPQEPLDDDIPF